MNLLITGAWAGASAYFAQIESMGHTVLFMEQEKEPLPCAYEWVEGVVCNGLFLHHSISLFINLRYIQLTSAGYDRIPMEEITKHGIEIHNARGVYSIPMAEFAIAGVLDLYKSMGQFREQQKRHSWVKNRRLRELYGSRVIIVGCGSVGTECAKRFRAFGCEVVGVDELAGTSKILMQQKDFDMIVSPVQLDEVLVQADVVILTLPLTDYTRGMIDKRRLQIMGENCILVNVSRGAVVDHGALEKWNGLAVLDVFEKEPLDQNNPIWEKENMIITPHNSFVGNGNAERLNKLILETLRKAVDR